MKFGPVPVAEAAGAILAHSIRLPGGRLRKGVTLDQSHVEALAAAGHDNVVVARLDGGDLHEDDAATALAGALAAGQGGGGRKARGVEWTCSFPFLVLGFGSGTETPG